MPIESIEDAMHMHDATQHDVVMCYLLDRYTRYTILTHHATQHGTRWDDVLSS